MIRNTSISAEWLKWNSVFAYFVGMKYGYDLTGFVVDRFHERTLEEGYPMKWDITYGEVHFDPEMGIPAEYIEDTARDCIYEVLYAFQNANDPLVAKIIKMMEEQESED
jgi:hypothetical protein